jgi:hypothetical protein
MHFSSGLSILETMGHQPEGARRELEIRLGLGTALNIAHGSSAPAVAEHYARAVTIGRQLGIDKQLFRAVWGSWYTNITTGRTRQALVLAEELVEAPSKLRTRTSFRGSHHCRYARIGLVSATLVDTERGIELYHPTDIMRMPKSTEVTHTGVCARSPRGVLWIAGLPEQAEIRRPELRLPARASSQPGARSARWSAALRQMP